MPVDEDNLDAIIVDLIKKTNTNFVQRQEITEIYKCAKRIELVDVPDPTIEDPKQTKKVLPMDDDLGLEITVQRREQIYDELISDIEKL